MARIHLRSFYLEDEAYTPFPRELRKGCEVFLKELGVEAGLASKIGLISATVIELDVAYRYRAEDVFSETTLERMLENPRREILLLMKIFETREPKAHLIKKFSAITNILLFALLSPRVKRAFRKALRAIRFEGLQLDEIERDNVKHLHNYDFFGMTIEERAKIWPFEQHLYMELSWEEPK